MQNKIVLISDSISLLSFFFLTALDILAHITLPITHTVPFIFNFLLITLLNIYPDEYFFIYVMYIFDAALLVFLNKCMSSYSAHVNYIKRERNAVIVQTLSFLSLA